MSHFTTIKTQIKDVEALIILWAAAAEAAAAAGEKHAPGHGDSLVGIYYCAGWWQKSPNKWKPNGRDWRPSE